MNNTQRQRYERIFEFLDTDGSGAIEEQDFLALAQDVLSRTGAPADSPNARSLQEAYRKGWESLRGEADLDADGRVTREEFLRRLSDAYDGGSPLRTAIDAVSDAEFDAMDVNGDGMVSDEELQRVLEIRGASKQQAEEAAKGLDADGDGYISRNEYREAWTAFHTGQDPNAPAENLQAIMA
jgi:Ca2+-binding EF-hand superfamily protein